MLFRSLVLAAAGLRRLERGGRITALLPVAVCVPAPGQGIIAVEIRQDDRRARELAAAIGDATAGLALRAERAVVDRLGGGCQMPLGAFCSLSASDELSMTGIVVSLDGSRAVRAQRHGPAETPEQLGIQVADELLAKGADSILSDARRAMSPTESHHP